MKTVTKKEEDYINKFSENRDIISQFLIKTKEIRKSKNNRPYIELVLQDKTGQIKARMFSNRVHKEYEKIETNTVNNINGKIQEFPTNSGKYNILINTIVPSKKYDEEDFIIEIPQYEENIDYLFETIHEIKNEGFKELLNSFFNDEEFKNKFLTAPAAKVHHHNYRGGLLIHTNEVIKICKTLAATYDKIDYDLLITGAILHDVGKIKTYDYETEDITRTYDGIMLEHIFIGSNMIQEKLNNISMNENDKIKLIHMILSHHGKTELGWGSCVDPMIPEAVALHQADDMSAKVTSSINK